ncbi:MAG TPA: TolC family protein [Methylibium sp.]|uniref:TolC family protein n=1 Tax=Methylibium sp. TaxID=2067992 RepID=UPI002DC0213F|nr:TolC family protein [Methylibium sp.]HEU4459545.1 TolC family protein [Methylibium sp.]
MNVRLPLASARRAVCGVLVLLVAWPTIARSASLSMETAVALAAERSRLVASASAQSRAASELAVAAGQRPDPVLRLGLNNLPIDGPDRFSVTRDFMTMRSVGVMQELTRADKRAARVERAERNVALADVGRKQAVAEVQRDAALAWLDRSFAESMRDQLRRQIEQAQQQVQAAEALYRSSRGSQTEVFTARGDLEGLRDRLDETEREIDVATVRLARFVGDVAKEPLTSRPAFALAADDALPIERTLVVAERLSQENAALAEARVTDAERRSDWSVELMLSQRGPAYSNMVSINLSVPLQWDQKNRQDREHAARLAMLDEARARLEDAERAVEADIRASQAAWRNQERRLRRHDEALLPLAEQRSAAALAAYAAGSGSLAGVLEARRNALQVHLDRLRIEADIARLWAQLTFLMPQDGPTTSRTAP